MWSPCYSLYRSCGLYGLNRSEKLGKSLLFLSLQNLKCKTCITCWMGKICVMIQICNPKFCCVRKVHIFFLNLFKSSLSFHLPGWCETQAQSPRELSFLFSSSYTCQSTEDSSRHLPTLGAQEIFSSGSLSWQVGYRLSKIQNILTLVKMVRPTLFGTVVIAVGTTAVGFCRREEKLGSTPNMARQSGDL